MRIYEPSTDEVDYTDTGKNVDTDNNKTEDIPGLQQLDTDNTNRVSEINEVYNTLINNLNNTQNPYQALQETIKARQIHNPKATKARQAIGSLYDALQILGTATAMGSQRMATPPSPQLSSAAEKQNNYALHMKQLQLNEDNNHRSRVDNINRLSAQFDFEKQKELNRLQQQQQQHLGNQQRLYSTERNKLITAYEKRNSDAANAIMRYNNSQNRKGNNSNGSSSTAKKEFTWDNITYTIPREREDDFNARVARLAKDSGISIYSIGYDTKLSGTKLSFNILRAILNNDIEGLKPKNISEAENILNTYFTSKQQNTTPQQTRNNFQFNNTTDW